MGNRTWVSWLAILALLGTAVLAVACQPTQTPTPVPTPSYSPCVGPEDYPKPYNLPCQRTGSDGLTTVFVGWERECPPLPTGPGLWECVTVYEQGVSGE